jgi:hypothetical protein
MILDAGGSFEARRTKEKQMKCSVLSLCAVAALAGCGGSSDTSGSMPDLGHTISCTSVRDTLLKPIDSRSTGAVSQVSQNGAVRTLFVDASAGGPTAAPNNPRLYLDLANGTAVDVTDKSAVTSTAWDLALKRPVIYTNGGDGGPGQGGATFLVGRDFDGVTAADAASVSTESFFDAQCNPKTDAVGDIETTFSGWYSYDDLTHVLTPVMGTFLVHGATGTLYKVAIDGYYAMPDGTMGMAGGKYLLRVAAL